MHSPITALLTHHTPLQHTSPPRHQQHIYTHQQHCPHLYTAHPPTAPPPLHIYTHYTPTSHTPTHTTRTVCTPHPPTHSPPHATHPSPPHSLQLPRRFPPPPSPSPETRRRGHLAICQRSRKTPRAPLFFLPHIPTPPRHPGGR